MSSQLTYAQRLARRAGNTTQALCAGIDPAPEATALLANPGPAARVSDGPGDGASARSTRASAMERFSGMVVEAVRDHASAVKFQLAWFETAGAPGLRALERSVEYARRADLLVVLDGKRGDIPHSAHAYADAWLGDDAASGICGDALTVNAAVGDDALTAMAEVAAARRCALYALLHTSNPGAARLQSVAAGSPADRPWWELLAQILGEVDQACGPSVVGAVVGATRPQLLDRVRELLPAAPLLLPGVGAQGGAPPLPRTADPLAQAGSAAPVELITASRSLLPSEPMETAGFRFAVSAAAAELRAQLGAPARLATGAPVE